MEIKEYREKNIKELRKLVTDHKAEIVKTVRNVVLQKEKNIHKPRVLKKELARMLTVIREKEILEE